MITNNNSALIIENNPIDRKFMQNTLESWNLNVHTEHDINKVRDHFALSDFKIILFHLVQDAMKSLDLLGWMRLQSNGALIPLIDQGTAITEDMCIRAGADEVITKPIVQKLFMQRVSYQVEKKNSSDALLDEIYNWGNLTLDVPQCEFKIGDKIVPLTKTELLLTQAFLAEPERVISRPELLNVIKVKDGIGSSHLIDTHLSRLRIKIKENGGGDHIYSIRGLGVRFMAPSHLARKSS
jgi:two-component system response regulator RegX3